MIFNIGPLEFILILLVAIIVLGPERMVTGARSFGRYIYKLVRSPTWRAIFSMSQEIRELPTKIMRESGLEETMNEMRSVGTDLNNELNQTVKDVHDEVSQAAIAVSAEVNQAVKDVNAELQQTAQEANQAAALASAEANQAIQPVDVESQPAAEPVTPAKLEQPEMVLQEVSAVEPAALSNNGHSPESAVGPLVQDSPATEAAEDSEPSVVYQEPVILKVPKVRKNSKAAKAKAVVPPEEETSIQPPESPSAHIHIE
jgi:sec-independent protein translocase protein TatB